MKKEKQYKILTVLFFITIFLLLIISGFLTRQYLQKPYGYYDGEYICFIDDHTYWGTTARDYVLSHEECHAHVKKDYEHFCSKRLS